LGDAFEDAVGFGAGEGMEAIEDGAQDGLEAGCSDDDTDILDPDKPAGLKLGGLFDPVGDAALEFGDANELAEMVAVASTEEDNDADGGRESGQGSVMDGHKIGVLLCLAKP
jgi:hypothetical protein